MIRTLSMCAATALVAACAHAPPPLHSTRLIVRETQNGGLAPLVRARVAGEEITFLLDTGAARSILPDSFARAHRLGREERTSDEKFVDVFGKVSSMRRLDGVPVQFDGEATAGAIDFVANPNGEDAILVPADLLRPGFAVVLDFQGQELRYEREEDALKRLLGNPSSRVRQIDFRSCIKDGFFSRTRRVVTATVNGVAAEMVLDTGATNSMLSRNHPAVRSLETVPGRLVSVSGVASQGEQVELDDIHLEFADTSLTLPISVNLRSDYECGRGLLGSDVLRTCTVVWGYDSLWASCGARATPAPRGQDPGR